MRYSIYLFLFIPSILFAQTYSIQTTILDSLIFETVQGRACTKLSAAQTIENQKLQAEIVAQGTVIHLQKQETTHMDEIIAAMQQQYNSLVIIKDEQVHKLKVRIRKLLIMVTGETGFIVIMLILFL